MAEPSRSIVALRIARLVIALLFAASATFSLFEAVHALAGHDYVAALSLVAIGIALAASSTTLVRPEMAE